MSGSTHHPRALLLLFAGLALAGCADANEPVAPLTPPSFAAVQSDIARAIAVQERFTPALMRTPGVLGTAVGLNADGRAVIRVFVESPASAVPPGLLDGVPVEREVTGLFTAVSNPTTRARPAPMGFSVGHPSITAGTIGARVVNGAGTPFILSNNHVLANVNDASIGDPILQPGPYDGGTYPADQVATLSAFQPISFSSANLMDAAIAQTTADQVLNETPLDDAYGKPSADIWGDGNGDGLFDNRNALLGLAVTKYGRTTGLTQGTITGINATLSICYEVYIIFCVRSATFQDQLIITPGSFSDGGDSGSLIVSTSGVQPVGLLFAGSTQQTIANRIDLVLDHFGVTIDGGDSPPPAPTTDIAIQSVTAASTVTLGDAVNVQVAVRNAGNTDVAGSFDVALQDLTDGGPIGTQSINGLPAGATTTLTFAWNTTGASAGAHTLRASQTLPDDNAANDTKSTTVTVQVPGASRIHVGDLDGTVGGGRTWSATVEVTVHDQNHNPINGATVVGTWNPSGLASDECTTGGLAGNGTCIFLFPSISKKQRQVSFTVTGVTMAGQTYQVGSNHDPDGDSNGTTITVSR